MIAIAQMQPSQLLASYLSFVATTAGLLPEEFESRSNGYTTLTFSTFAHEPPTHACLYVPHLGYSRSPIHRRFFDANGNQRKDAVAKKYTSNSRTTFATEFVRLQKIIDEAIELKDCMKDPYTEVPHAVRRHLGDDRTPENYLYSAILLSSIHQRADSIEHPAKLFMSSSRQFVNKDAKALLTELAYAALKKCTNEHQTTDSENPKCQLGYADKMIKAWYNALILTQDPAYKDERIFAGIRTCFASAIHLRNLAQFLDQLYLLPPNPSVEDDLRIALAKLVFAEHNDKQRRVALEFTAQKMRNAITTWARQPHRLEHVPAARHVLSQLEHISPTQMQVG